jgi:hypothetical protein
MRYFLVCLLTFLFSTGCGVFQNETYPHYDSCGPEALYNAIHRLGLNSSQVKISREILDDSKCHSLLRDVLSMFHGEAKHITFPSEIKSYLKKYNIKMTILPVEALKTLTPDKTAIVLVHKKDSLSYHWGCFPTTSGLSSFYGEGFTAVKQVILLERR